MSGNSENVHHTFPEQKLPYLNVWQILQKPKDVQLTLIGGEENQILGPEHEGRL